MPSERRKSIRKRTDQLLYLELGGDNGGIILNLSEEGCEFQTIGPVLEKELPFSFAIGGGRQIQGRALVNWLNHTNKVGGLCFMDLPPESREQIHDWLEEAKGVDDMGSEFELPPDWVAESEAKLRRRKLRQEARLRSLQQLPSTPHPESTASPHLAQHLAVSHSAGLGRDLSVQSSIDLLEGKTAVPPTPFEAPPASRDAQASTSQFLTFRASPRVPRSPHSLTAPRASSGFRWGTGAIVLSALFAVVPIIYHQQVGHGLIWLGTAIARDAPRRETAPQATPEATALGSAQPVTTVSQQPAALQPGPEPIAEFFTPIEPQPDTGKGDTSFRAPGQRPITTNDVQALWSLVESGDTRAEVLLADHYLRGDGVARSCGQARVLLEAAVRRANSEAKRKLDELEQNGCS
jgi:hypothetical protein